MHSVLISHQQLSKVLPMDTSNIQMTLTCTDDGQPTISKTINVTMEINETVVTPKELVLINTKDVPENTDSFVVGDLVVVNMLSHEQVQGVSVMPWSFNRVFYHTEW